MDYDPETVLTTTLSVPCCGPCTCAASFYSLGDLLQFYANAGAAPSGSPEEGYQPLDLPHPSPQSSLPHYPGFDVFAMQTAHRCGGQRAASEWYSSLYIPETHVHTYSTPDPILRTAFPSMSA